MHGIQLSSGIFIPDRELKLLRMMVEYGFIRWSDESFILKSGIESHVYVFGREDLTDNPDFNYEVSFILWFRIRKFYKENPDILNGRRAILIGIPTAGTAMAAGASLVSNRVEIPHVPPIGYRIMREKLKLHGAHHDWVNGKPDPEFHHYWSVDNVVTDAASKFEANERLAAAGYPVQEMPQLIFVDRQQGGVQRLERESGFGPVVVAYQLLDLVEAFWKLDLWPKEALEETRKEVEEHQFT